jgi:hypothetical protein
MRLLPYSTLVLVISVGPVWGAPRNESKTNRPVDPVALHEKARALMQDLDFEAALPLLRKAIGAPSLTSVVRAQLWVDAGICLVRLDDTNAARDAFEKGLAEDASVPFPDTAPPKARWLFDQVRRPAPVKVEPPPARVENPKPEPPKTDMPKKLEPPRLTQPPTSIVATPPRSWVGPIVCGAAAVVATATGIIAASASTQAAQALSGGLHERAETTSLVARQQSMATLSIGAYVGAGVAAGAGVLWAILGAAGTPPVTLGAGVSKTSVGASVGIAF